MALTTGSDVARVGPGSRIALREALVVVLAVMHPITLDLLTEWINLIIVQDTPMPYLCGYVVVCAVFTVCEWNCSGRRPAAVSYTYAVLLVLAALVLVMPRLHPDRGPFVGVWGTG